MAQEVPQDPGSQPAVVVRFEGQLSEAWASRLLRARDEVRSSGADLFVIVLDTPGGEVELMKRLGNTIDDIRDDAQTVAFVTHRAWSAGAFIAMACDEIWMAPGASIGASMPVAVGPGGTIIPGLEDLQEKMNAALRADFRSWAESHNRDPAIAEAFVDNEIELKEISVDGRLEIVSDNEYDEYLRQGIDPVITRVLCPAGELLALTVKEAQALGYCDGEANNLEALFLGSGWPNAVPVEVEANWSESLVDWIGGMSWLLLLAAAFFLVVAFNMPGLGAPEAAAVVCFAIYLFYNHLVGLAEWTDIMLVGGGLILLFIELFVTPGGIFLGVLGGVMVLVGLVLSMQDFVIPDGAIEWGTFRTNLFAFGAGAVLIPMAFMYLFRTVVGPKLGTGPTPDFAGTVASLAGPSGEAVDFAVRVGDPGEALTDLRPSGRVDVAGLALDARSEGGYLEAGTSIRVLRLEGGTLVVGPASETT